MQKNTGVLIALAMLVMGLGIGYTTAASKAPIDQNNSNSGGHMMPDGRMMGGAGSSMTMTDTMASMNADLQGKTGDNFDRAFLAGMIVHHQGAVQMAQMALVSAKHQEIKDLAAGIISAQNKEISEMQVWERAWYNQ